MKRGCYQGKKNDVQNLELLLLSSFCSEKCSIAVYHRLKM